MSKYDNTDQGVLFKNAEKETDSHPDYKGDLNVGGQDYWLSAWVNESAKGTKYIKLKVKLKEARNPMAEKSRPVPVDDGFDSDSIPF